MQTKIFDKLKNQKNLAVGAFGHKHNVNSFIVSLYLNYSENHLSLLFFLK